MYVSRFLLHLTPTQKNHHLQPFHSLTFINHTLQDLYHILNNSKTLPPNLPSTLTYFLITPPIEIRPLSQPPSPLQPSTSPDRHHPPTPLLHHNLLLVHSFETYHPRDRVLGWAIGQVGFCLNRRARGPGLGRRVQRPRLVGNALVNSFADTPIHTCTWCFF